MTSARSYFNRNTRRWQAIVELGRDERGKRKQVFRTTPRAKNTRAEARRLGRQIVSELDAGSYVAPSDMLVRELLETWLSDVARHQVSARSYDRYASIIRLHLVPALGGVQLTSLRAEQVQRCYSGLIDKGLAPASVHKVHAVLHSALTYGVRMHLLARNPTDEATLPKIRRREMTALSEARVGELLRAAEGTPVEVPLLVLVTLGVRRGELLGLTWDDVDLDGGRLSVRRTLEESSDGVAFREPKTARGSRSIALPGVTVEALRGHHTAQTEMPISRPMEGQHCMAIVDRRLLVQNSSSARSSLAAFRT